MAPSRSPRPPCALYALDEGEWAGGHWTWTGRHTAELMGIPATGKTVEVHGLGLYRLASTAA